MASALEHSGFNRRELFSCGGPQMAPTGVMVNTGCSAPQSAFADAAAAGPPTSEAYSCETAPSGVSSFDSVPAASFVSGKPQPSTPNSGQQRHWQQQQWQQPYQAGVYQQKYTHAEGRRQYSGAHPGASQLLLHGSAQSAAGSTASGGNSSNLSASIASGCLSAAQVRTLSVSVKDTIRHSPSSAYCILLFVFDRMPLIRLSASSEIPFAICQRQIIAFSCLYLIICPWSGCYQAPNCIEGCC